MGTEPTERDRIWATIATRDGKYSVDDVSGGRYHVDTTNGEIREVLQAAYDLGVLEHDEESGEYWFEPDNLLNP